MLRLDLSPPRLLAAYGAGIFPMADDDGAIHWLAPDPRAIVDFDEVILSRSLRAVIRRGSFEVTVNRTFGEVIAACAARKGGTWISAEIIAAYTELHRLGWAHSVEAWQGDKLAGGLYGVSMGGVFFGESMFHRATDASKVAFAYLVARLRDRGFAFLDVQFQTPHLQSLGAKEIRRDQYERRLCKALLLECSFVDEPALGRRLKPRGSP